MANTDKNILITPNVGASGEPTIKFTGANNTPITLRVLDDGTISFEATAGQLFSISDGLTGTIFSVNDISGIPSIEILDTGEVRIAQYSGNVGIGKSSPTTKLDVNGTITGTVIASSASAGVAPFTTSSSANVTNLNADYLDGQHATYFINTSSSAQTKTGDLTVTGTATAETLDLNEVQVTAKLNTISVTTAVLIDSFTSANYRGAEYIFQFSQSTTNFAITKVLLIHNGTDVAISEYGSVEIGTSIPYTFNASYSLGNLELTVTCSTANINPVDIKFTRTLIDA